MKLILSRKGTDSSAGGLPSPIMPEGRLLSLPIPQSDAPIRYSELMAGKQSLSSLIKQLGGKQWRSGCHLDPDIDRTLLKDASNWLPAFGQFGAAQRHLEQEGVGKGDLFLFFGWFRQTERVKGKIQFVKGAPDIHQVFGWMQVGEILKPSPSANEAILACYPQLANHPHMQKDYQFNTIYLPSEQLTLNGRSTGLPGFGTFPQYSPALQLTTPGENRTHWTLPQAFYPDQFETALSYHRQSWRWSRVEERVQLQAAARGQEFVLDLALQPKVVEWLAAQFFQQLF
ncbi:hypothetical protein QKW35_08460 [Pontibacterium granulatum]|uniref:Nmad3 family putative nucleotide modification protein n=1 Tax=Pontibacterium granulatum TaxID=2036029 RepID=UPI00249BF9D8|nr:hypothetical protein [Pontibacterium granulatum]MDI3324405.1 hypothetical protein [Pontibacterium granulatum]